MPYFQRAKDPVPRNSSVAALFASAAIPALAAASPAAAADAFDRSAVLFDSTPVGADDWIVTLNGTIGVGRAVRAGMPLSLLMVDIDHLKELNDRGGHIAGDVALAVVGEVLNRTCRSRDVASRF